jgi:hypothetical protein
MQNPYLKVNTEYVKILEALIANADQAFAKNKAHCIEGGQLIREYRTVGIKAARQTGLSSSMRQWVVNHPNETLCLFKDANMAKYAELSLMAAKADGSGFQVPFRSLTARDLREVFEGRATLNLELTFIEDCRYIFVDDADVTLNRCGFKSRVFNDWVYSTFGSQVVVIHLG